MLINDIGGFSVYTSKNADYKTLLEENVTSILATKIYCHRPPCRYNSPLH